MGDVWSERVAFMNERETERLNLQGAGIVAADVLLVLLT